MGKKKAAAQGTGAQTAFERLSPKHKAFVTEFMKDFNATRAYIRAGYSANGAEQGASRLLRNVEVVAAIGEQLEARGITPERIKCEIAEVAFGADIADVSEFLNGRLTMEQLREKGVDTRLVKSASHTSSAQGKTQRVEMYDRLAALEKLIKIQGMVTGKHEITQTRPVHVMFDDGTPAERAAAAGAAAEKCRKAAQAEADARGNDE